MNSSINIRIWLCDCGRVHVETKNYRMSYTPAEFLDCLRRAADMDGTGAIPPQQQPCLTRLNEACETNTMASRAVQRQLLTPVA